MNKDKTEELKKVADEIKVYKGLEIARTATNAVPGEGNPDATIMFIGEAPGFHEDRQGRPFVGQAGKLLEKALSQIGLTRNDVYITNIVKFRPPENRDPTPEEIEANREWLDRQIYIIHPPVIATLGRFSMAKFLGPQSISRIHGQHKKILWTGPNSDEKLDILVFPMYHPAAALRSTEVLKQFESDFVKLSEVVKQTMDSPTNISGSEGVDSQQTSLF
jgi:uracil-DNA glycosylase